MTKKVQLMVLLVVILVGCASPPVSASMPAGQTPVITITNTPTITLSPAITLVPTPAMTAIPEARFIHQCLPVDNREFALNEIALGTVLVIWHESNSANVDDSRRIFHDLQTGNEYQLQTPSSTESIFVSEETSPNRKLFARLEITFMLNKPKRAALWVLDAHANIIAKMEFNRADLVSLSWLDDERLLIETEKYGTLLLVNPFTGEQQLRDDKLPDLYPYNPYYDTYSPWFPVVYSPDLKWVIYFSQHKESNSYHSGAVLVDLATNQTIWKHDYGIFPLRSPDGQVFAFVPAGPEQQLYLFSRSGQLKAVLDKNLPHEVDGISWSPDGNLIAFRNAGILMVYDRQKDRVIDTCINLTDYIFLDAPWSPDSRQLVVKPSGDSMPLMLVDWESRIAYKNIKALPNAGAAYKWMNSIP
jgi:dipeptidyl aminopeptidase/acylaminoacyl peptidase